MLPFLWMVFWLTRNSIARLGFWRYGWLVDTPLKRLLLFDGIIPAGVRTNLAVSVFVWGTTFIVCTCYEVLCPLGRLKFLAIFACHPKGIIKPTALQLSKEDFNKFNAFRNIVERLFYVCIVQMALSAPTVVFLFGVFANAFEICWPVAIFYVVATFYWSTASGQGLW